MLKENAGSAAGDTVDDCCTKACAVADCSTGYLLKDFSQSALAIGGSQDRCCDPACSIFECPANLYLIAAASETRGSTESICCAKACSSYTCSESLLLKVDAARLVGETDEVCCDGLFQCTPYTNRSGDFERQVSSN